MRVDKLIALSSFLLAGNVAFAAELDRDDVPDPCRPACHAVLSVAHRCDRDNHNDTSEMDCICNSDQAGTRIPHCEACIAQFRTDHPRDEDYDGGVGEDDGDGDGDGDDNDGADPHDNDAYDILTSCGFETTSYKPSSMHSASSSSASASASPSSSSVSVSVSVSVSPSPSPT